MLTQFAITNAKPKAKPYKLAAGDTVAVELQDAAFERLVEDFDVVLAAVMGGEIICGNLFQHHFR